MFSTASFLITFREVLEAALIVGILLVYVSKIEQRKLKKQIWVGTVIGIVLSIVFAVLFQLLLGGFSGYEEIFEGFTMIIASLLLGWMIIWMSSEGSKIKEGLERKVDQTLEESKKYGVLLLTVFSVLREGVETVLFLSGVEAIEGNYFTMLWSGVLGLVVALIVAALVFLSGKRINIKAFFITTGILLVFFAAGMFTYGIHELQEINWFGPETHWLQKQLWDTSGFIDDKNTEIGRFLRSLFGYQDKPTALELIVYLGFFATLSIVLLMVRRKKKKFKGKR
ncbi:MAG: FTR1 family iron permease [Candidatus Heimdallarchaeaceae archaeon]